MAILDISNSTTVGNFNDTIHALEEARKKTTKAAEQARFDELINKYTTSKNKLINICKNDIIKGNMMSDAATRVEVGKLTRDNFKALSLQAWNNLLDAEHQHKESELKDRDPSQAMIDFLDGKSGINLMTGVKATLTTAAVAALCSLDVSAFATAIGLGSTAAGAATAAAGAATAGAATAGAAAATAPISIISIIPEAIGALFALNPVIGIAAGALLGLGVIKLTKKIFGPEIKKLWANIKVRQAVNKQAKASQDKELSEKDITEALGGKSSEDYQKDAEAEVERTTKRNDGTYEREFSDRAFAIATGDGKETEKKVAKLRKDFAGKLEPDEIDNLLRSAGLAVEQPSLGDIATDLKTGGFKTAKPRGGTRSEPAEDFYEFRKAYNKLITQIADPTIEQAVKSRAIRDLRAVASDPAKFIPSSSPTAEDIARQPKLQELCGGMVEILAELHKQVGLDASKAATIANLQAQLEGDRGLAADQIAKL